MTTAVPIQPPAATQWSRRQWLGVALACLASAGLGYWASDRRLGRLAKESGQRQVEEFVAFADRLGALDRARIEEALIVASESEWEDEGAVQRQDGDPK